MEPYEYQTLFQAERSYWWYRALHEVTLDVLRKEDLNNAAYILDAGCGTGQNVSNIGQYISEHSFGVDLSNNVLPYWKTRRLRRVCIGSVNSLPFPECVFDAVVSVDVLECDEVDQKDAYGELWRVVRNNGLIVLVVPAYRWLLTKEHHRAVHASRRYSRGSLRSLIGTRPTEIVRITHLFALLLPVIAAYRLGLRILFSGKSHKPKSELRALPRLVNEALYGITALERLLLRSYDMPFGSSIVAVVRKKIQQ